MAWTSPMTFTAGTTLTAAQLNTHLRDNLLETAPAKATTAGRIFVATGANAIAERAIETATVATNQTTTSTSFTDLATTGPAVTLTTGTRALVFITAGVDNTSAGANSLAAAAVTGATTDAAADARAALHESAIANAGERATSLHMFTGLTAGSNTFTMRYRVTAGTGSWENRQIVVIAL